MKLLCDVCNLSPATVICCADQASLCDACDSSIHGANKLSGKHQRLALIHPSSSHHHHHDQNPQADAHLPLCDICQDKVGYFFCLEDRALLCRECDFSIHSANSISSRHKRFLMTGIQVALQPSNTSECVQTRSPSQKSSSSNTNVSQLSPPSMQISPKSMHRNSKDIQNRPQNVQNSPPNMQLSHQDTQTRSLSIQGSPSRTQISSRTTLKTNLTSPPKQSVSKRKISKSPILDQQKLRRVPLSKRVDRNNEEFSKPHEKQMVHTNEGESSKLYCEKLAVLQNGENSLRAHEKFISHNNAEEYLKPNQKHMAINYVESLKLHEGHMVLNLDEEVLKTERRRMVLNHEEELLERYQEHMVPNSSEASFGIGVIPASFQSKTKAIDTLKSSSIPLEFQQQPQITQYSSKVVGMQRSSNNISSTSVHQQFLINSERHIIDCGSYQSRIDPNYLHKVNSGGAVLAHAGVDNCTRKGSISEYLTETIPGWKVDEIFSLCDTDTLHNFVNCGSSRPDASNSPDSDLFIDDCSCFDHLVLDRSEAQVPSMASPPTLSGIPRFIKPGVYGKSREQPDLGFLLSCDDTLVVPDIGGISSPPDSPPLKRRRIYTDLW